MIEATYKLKTHNPTIPAYGEDGRYKDHLNGYFLPIIILRTIKKIPITKWTFHPNSKLLTLIATQNYYNVSTHKLISRKYPLMSTTVRAIVRSSVRNNSYPSQNISVFTNYPNPFKLHRIMEHSGKMCSTPYLKSQDHTLMS